MILVNRTTNGWPGFPESKHSLNVVSNQFLSSVFLNFFFVYNASKTTDFTRNWIEDNRINTKERYGRRSWFCFNRTREGCDDDRSHLRLPNSRSQRYKSLNANICKIDNTNQKVSTIAYCFLPTSCSLYQFHASGLIGSPTLPRTRKLLKS